MNRIVKGNSCGWLVAVLCCCLLLCASAYAEPKVGVLVPELREPFKSIFDAIETGIDQKLKQRSSRFVLKKDYDPRDLINWLRSENIDAVIALGILGQKASAHIPNNTPTVLGALLTAPRSTTPYPGVALTPNPGSLFQLLIKLANTRTKVVVVYNPLKNSWLVELAKRQAAEYGVQLVTYEATDLKQAAIIYHEIFSGNDLDNAALWLLQDSTVVDKKVVLPFILEKTWQKSIVVFSSALGHVKKGVLFSMFPNNVAHGMQLAELMLRKSADPTALGNKIFPSEGLQTAINSRTAEHLGLNLSRSKLRQFDVVFPISN